jgi:hypothetical protein
VDISGYPWISSISIHIQSIYTTGCDQCKILESNVLFSRQLSTVREIEVTCGLPASHPKSKEASVVNT